MNKHWWKSALEQVQKKADETFFRDDNSTFNVCDAVIAGNKNEINGNGNTIKGSHCIVRGDGNTVKGSDNTIIGADNTIEGSDNTINGNNNKVEGDRNTRMRLDRGPWNRRRVARKAIKYSAWAIVALSISTLFLFIHCDIGSITKWFGHDGS